MTTEIKQNKLGLWSSIALVVGNMIGSGVFMLPASLAIFGGVGILGWFFSSLGAILLAIIFGNLSRLLSTETGGPYAYTKVKLGNFPAFLVAWSYWISIWCANAAITVALVGYLSVFFPILSTNASASIFTGLAFIWLFSWINTKPLRVIGIVQIITTSLKIIPILLVGCLGIFFIDGNNLSWEFNRLNISSITTMTTLTFFAFLGMESATIPSDGIQNPEKTIKRATILGTMFTVIIYVLSSVAIMGIVPPEELINSNAPFADAASLFLGTSAKYIIAIGAIVSTLGALNGWILIQGQIPMAAANDKLFPPIFGETNANGSPKFGIIISSVFVSLLMMINYSKGLVSAFTFMITLSTLSVITPYLFSILSYVILLLEQSNKTWNKKLVLPILVFIFLLWIIVGCGTEAIFYGFILLIMGIPLYIWLKKNNKL